jgi:hypothetical protein
MIARSMTLPLTRCIFAVVVLLALFPACGDDAPSPSTETHPAIPSCDPHLPDRWAPVWKPPSPRSAVCTKTEIDREYAGCSAPNTTRATCDAARANVQSTCVDCLYSDENDPTYRAIVLSKTAWRTNTAGCIALLEEGIAGLGCGAKVQAASQCADAACSTCTPFAEYVKCRQKATQTVCWSYQLDAVCILRPEFASCTEYATSADYYRAVSYFFCGAPGGSNDEGVE